MKFIQNEAIRYMKREFF